MTKIITVTDAIRSFSDIIGQVYYKGEEFNIKKGANIVAKLMPVREQRGTKIKDLNHIFQSAPHLDKDDIKEFEVAIEQIRAIKEENLGDKWD